MQSQVPNISEDENTFLVLEQVETHFPYLSLELLSVYIFRLETATNNVIDNS